MLQKIFDSAIDIATVRPFVTILSEQIPLREIIE